MYKFVSGTRVGREGEGEGVREARCNTLAYSFIHIQSPHHPATLNWKERIILISGYSYSIRKAFD